MISNTSLACRFCHSPLSQTFVDLGMSPIANDYIPFDRASSMEPFYPLHVFICKQCLLVQLPTIRLENEIFTDEYAYFSSYSSSWLAHAKEYVEKIMSTYQIKKNQLVVELASNDGYLLQYFQEKGVPVLGIEPTANTAEIARQKGIETLVKFFGVDVAQELAAEGKTADLLIGNNVLAHVPDLNDFVEGMKILLKQTGIITMEFPHLLQLIELNQFDTIYHEHYSYFSFHTVQKIFSHHGLTIFDVEEIPTHGGSLRIYTQHTNGPKPISDKVDMLNQKETAINMHRIEGYTEYTNKVTEVKRNLLTKLVEIKNAGKSIIGYGAPAKGNTFLNYCGIRNDFLDYTVDASPHKQKHYLPGVRIPIYHPSKIKETKPSYIFILPWNLKDEIIKEHSYVRDWGGKFLTAIPKIKEY